MSARQKLKTGADTHADRIVSSLVEVLDAERDAYVTCERCQKRTAVRLPDGSARVNAAAKLVELGYGRAREQTAAEAREEAVEQKLRDLREMTDEELAAIVIQAETGEAQTSDAW